MWRLLFLLSLRFLTKCGYATFSIVIINVVITLVTFSDGTKKPTDLAPQKNLIMMMIWLSLFLVNFYTKIH